jgi:putative transposase
LILKIPSVKIWTGGIFMGRKLRIEYDGAIYHAIQRGNNRECIFERQEDKDLLLRDIIHKQSDLGFKLMGYVIMDNHYHILLQTEDKPLKTIMHGINNRYSKHYNRQHGRTGHVFGERYKAILVQNESYLLTLLRYIHQNPVRAGICSKIEEYRWSSDSDYRTGNAQEVDIDVILGNISINKNIAIKQYKEFMMEIDETDYSKEQYAGEEGFQLIAVHKVQVRVRKRLDEILADTGINEEGYRRIKAGSRRRDLTPYKIEYARKAYEYNYTLKEIGQHIKLSDTAVFKMINSQAL